MQYHLKTNNIIVSVQPEYLVGESDESESRYVWSYQVKLENGSDETVQLLNRHWRIIDGNGLTQEVRGPGVVGHQPILMTGESFEYASGTQLPTDSGIMVGRYEMMGENDRTFWIDVPMFSLDSPKRLAKAH